MNAAGGPRRFPFEAALGLGIAHLRLSPDAFWSLAPRELLCALRCAPGQRALIEAPARGALEALMARFPD